MQDEEPAAPIASLPEDYDEHHEEHDEHADDGMAPKKPSLIERAKGKVKKKLGLDKEPVVKTEEEEKKSELVKELIPEKEMSRAGFGIALGSQEKVDLGGEKTFAQAEKKPLKREEKIDLDRELFQAVSPVLDTLSLWEAQAKEAGTKDPRIEKLTPLARMMLKDYQKWQTRAKAIEQIKQGKVEGVKYSGDERIFQDEGEAQRAMAFIRQCQILATHAMGHEMTNGGKKTLSFKLTQESIDSMLEGGAAGTLEEAGNGLLNALLGKPEERPELMRKFIAAWGAPKIGLAVGALCGNPLLGAAVGAGAGLAYIKAERAGGPDGIRIGNWELSFPSEFKKGERERALSFTLKFDPTLPAGGPDSRIANDPIGRLFIDTAVSGHLSTQGFIRDTERTKRAVLKRLGYRVEDFGDWNFDDLTKTQERFLRELGHNRRKIASGDFDSSEQTKILEEVQKRGADLWMFDPYHANVTAGAGSTLEFDRKVRAHIQTVLQNRYPDLSQTQISVSESCLDWSNLSIYQRHEIELEALDLAGADICSKEGAEVIAEIVKGGEEEIEDREAQAGILEQRAKGIEDGTISVYQEEINKDQRYQAELEVAQAQAKVEGIEKQRQILTTVATEIDTKQSEFDSLEEELTEAERVQGNRSDLAAGVAASGKIAELETDKGTTDQDIEEIDNELGLSGYDTAAKTYPAGSVLEEYFTLSAEIATLKTQLRTANLDRLYSARDTLLSRGQDTTIIDGYISSAEGNLQQLEAKQKRFGIVETRKRELEQSKLTKKEEQTQIKSDIKAAEKIVSDIRDRKEAAKKALEALKRRRDEAVAEIQRLTGAAATVDVAQEQVYSTLLAKAKTDLAEMEKDFREKGLLPESIEKATGERKYKVVAGEQDKELVKAYRETARICKTDGEEGFNVIISSILEGRVSLEDLADKAGSYENLLKLIFGDKVDPKDWEFVKRLLSKSAVVEAAFDSLGLDDEKAKSFFHDDSQGLNVYKRSRENRERIKSLRMQIESTKIKKEAGFENQVQILEKKFHRLQDENVRLLHDVYERRIAAFLGEHRVTTAEFVTKLIDRMRENAMDNNPFGDTVRFVESIPPRINPDGVVTIFPPDVNPRDGSWVNRGEQEWRSPAGYQVNGHPVEIQATIPFTNAGQIDVSLEIRPADIEGLYEVVPAGVSQLSTADNRLLTDLGLLNVLYDGVNKRGASDEAIGAVLDKLPSARPADLDDTTNSDVQAINAFLVFFGLEREAVEILYPPAAGGARKDIEAKGVIIDGLNKKVKKVELKTQAAGFPTERHLETWLTTAPSYNLGGIETGRMFACLARGICENSQETNRELLGDRVNNRFTRFSSHDFEIANENGELSLYWSVGIVLDSGSLKEAVEIRDEAERLVRFPGLTDVVLDDILLKTGKSAMEAIRLRQS